MAKPNRTPFAAKALSGVAKRTMSVTSNSRCIFIYHQPKQPAELRRYRKF